MTRSIPAGAAATTVPGAIPNRAPTIPLSTPRPNSGGASSASGRPASPFAPLLNLHARSTALIDKLADKAAQLGAAGARDPASAAKAKQLEYTVQELRRMKTQVGVTPGSATRRTYAELLGRLEAGGSLTISDHIRDDLARGIDANRIDPDRATALRRSIAILDRGDERLQEMSLDPALIANPHRLAQVRSIGASLGELASVIRAAAASPTSIDAHSRRALEQAESQRTTGFAVRDALAALRS